MRGLMKKNYINFHPYTRIYKAVKGSKDDMILSVFTVYSLQRLTSLLNIKISIDAEVMILTKVNIFITQRRRRRR